MTFKNLKSQFRNMCASERIKAFITDMFMINMPLLYLMTYVFLDGKEDFTHNHLAIFACVVGYGIITSLFLAKAKQTPGFRYAGLYAICDNGENMGFLRAFARYMLWLVGVSFLFGILIGILRKDGKCLHDIICHTRVVRANITT